MISIISTILGFITYSVFMIIVGCYIEHKMNIIKWGE
jgi:hypothetical protein